MASRRSETVDYSRECTVLILFTDGELEHRIVYERPQPHVPAERMNVFDALRVSQHPTDEQLTAEAKWIFGDMKAKDRIPASSELMGIFIARTAAAALEMNL